MAALLGFLAFFVIKFNAVGSRPVYYMLCQLILGPTGGPGALTASALPCVILGSSFAYNYIAFSFALGIGGTNNPWAGRAVNDGADYKGSGAGTTAVWAVPSGGTAVHVWPRSNNNNGTPSVGTYQSLKQNMVAPLGSYNLTTAVRAHFWADDDSLAVMTEVGDAGTLISGLVFGPVTTVRSGLTYGGAGGLWPLALVSSQNTTHLAGFDNSLTFGNIAGGTADIGGVLTPSNGVMPLICQRHGFVASQPNKLITPNEYEAYPPIVGVSDQGTLTGYLGQGFPFVKEIYNVPTFNFPTNKTSIVLGNSTTASYKFHMPWDGATTPKSGATRAGVDWIQ